VTWFDQHCTVVFVEPTVVPAARSRADPRFDTIRITAYVYAVCFLSVFPVASLSNANRLQPNELITLGLMNIAFATVAWSATRRARVGYYFCLLLSILLLPAVPMGTVLGWNMLRALRQNRSQFWPNSPRPRWMRRDP
jgi:hypothetical protein